MLGTLGIVRAVVEGLKAFPGVPVVVDPVMVAQSGDPLLDNDAVDAVRTELMPLAVVVTPNMPEAARLLGGADSPGRSGDDRTGDALARAGRERRAAERGARHGPHIHRYFRRWRRDDTAGSAAHPDEAHAWHRLHAVRGHRGGTRQGCVSARGGRGRQGLCHRRHRRRRPARDRQGQGSRTSFPRVVGAQASFQPPLSPAARRGPTHSAAVHRPPSGTRADCAPCPPRAAFPW